MRQQQHDTAEAGRWPTQNIPGPRKLAASDSSEFRLRLTFHYNLVLQPMAQGGAEVWGMHGQSCRAGPLMLRRSC
jgi:hypothetical protein